MVGWVAIERPGYSGNRRDERIRTYNDRYGIGNWRLVWQWGSDRIDQPLTCQLYEDAYYADSFNREGLWRELQRTAREVYDHTEADIASGLDYRIQTGSATHLQDIAIRRVFFRRGWPFQGTELVQIRSKAGWGKHLSPGKVSFHLPEMIAQPPISGWWDAASIEDFYQSNKLLETRVQEH